MPGSKKCNTSRASKCTGKFFVRTPNGAEFHFYADDWWTSTRETTPRAQLRSRFVAIEFNTEKVNGLYASTPPLEALKLLISDAATRTSDTFKEEEEEEKVIMVNDVARAYFEAKVERTIAIELPTKTRQRLWDS